MKKAVPTDPTDLEIAQALTRSGGSARGAARILSCGRARIRKYVDERMIFQPVTDDTPGAPLTDFDREYDAAMAEFMAEELAS